MEQGGPSVPGARGYLVMTTSLVLFRSQLPLHRPLAVTEWPNPASQQRETSTVGSSIRMGCFYGCGSGFPHEVCVCVRVCVCVCSWSALQFTLQDLKIVRIWQILHVHPLFVLYCFVCYKRECVCVPMMFRLL